MASSKDKVVWDKIAALDLAPVALRLTKVCGWSDAKAEQGCQQYRRFLFLKYKYGEQYSLPPSMDIDEVWHQHILRTQSYREDCMQWLGCFLDHHPHHGHNNEITQAQLEQDFASTKALYQAEFGEPLHGLDNEIVLLTQLKNVFKRVFNFAFHSKLEEPRNEYT